MIKILTVCRAGLVRSVALMDVLKLHFQPVDVLACGIGTHQLGRMNSEETLSMLFDWADKIVVMEHHYKDRIPDCHIDKVLICETGPDTYGSSKNPQLIDMVWRWARINKQLLGIEEHKEIL